MSIPLRSRHRASHGFTLIELLIGIAVIALLLLVALPSFGARLVAWRAQHEALALSSSLQSAAIATSKFGEPVSVRAQGDTWTAGWRVFRDANGNGVQDAGDALVTEVGPVGEARVMLVANAESITFDTRARLQDNAPFAAIVCARDADTVSEWRVTVARTGSIHTRQAVTGVC